VTGWDERRQVLEPVRVEAPHERAHDLSDRRDAHDEQRQQPLLAGVDREQRRQHDARECAEGELTFDPDAALKP